MHTSTPIVSLNVCSSNRYILTVIVSPIDLKTAHVAQHEVIWEFLLRLVLFITVRRASTGITNKGEKSSPVKCALVQCLASESRTAVSEYIINNKLSLPCGMFNIGKTQTFERAGNPTTP